MISIAVVESRLVGEFASRYVENNWTPFVKCIDAADAAGLAQQIRPLLAAWQGAACRTIHASEDLGWEDYITEECAAGRARDMGRVIAYDTDSKLFLVGENAVSAEHGDTLAQRIKSDDQWKRAVLL